MHPTALWEVPAFTQLVLPTATGPHRDLASVRLRPMPSAADSSVRPAPVCPSSASHTTATAPLPTPLASATLRPTPGTLQSWPRATQAGPESSPPDSSPPATDADWARGPPRLTPTPPTTPRGPHRELTVWDTTATAGGASGPPMPSATTATLPSALREVPAFTQPALPSATGPHRDLASVRPRPIPGVTPPSTPGGPLPSLTSRGPPRDSASVTPRRRLPPPRLWLPTPMAPPRLLERLSGDSQLPRLLRSVRPSPPSATATGPPRALTLTAGPQPTTGDKDLSPLLSNISFSYLIA